MPLRRLDGHFYKTSQLYHPALGCVILPVAYLCAGPIVQGLWATYRWDKVPCALIWNDSTYVYDYEGHRYYSAHLDFWHWDRAESVATFSDLNLPALDHVCYVKPHSPKDAVLYADSLNHLTGATRPLLLSAFVVIAAGVMTVALRRRARTFHSNAEAPTVQ